MTDITSTIARLRALAKRRAAFHCHDGEDQ